MTVEKNVQRKLVQVKYDTNIVQGDQISVQAGGEHVEILTSDNDGLVQVSYPQEFTGPSHLVIAGSKSGEDAGEIQVD